MSSSAARITSRIFHVIKGCLRTEHGVEENIWTEEGQGNRGMEEIHNDELNDLYSSPNIVRVIKSRRKRWAGHVARMGGERESWWGNRREGTTGET